MTDADYLWKLLAALSLLGNLVLLARQVFGRAEKREVSPSPLPVTKADKFVLEETHDALVERVDGHDKELRAIRDKMESNYNAIMTAEARGRRELHQEINEVNKQLAGIAAIVEGLKGLPERIARDVGILFGQGQTRGK